MEEIDIKDFLKYLKKFAIPAIILAAVALIGTVIYETYGKPNLYKSYTTVVLAQNANEGATATTLNDINVNQKLIGTYSEIIKSKLILNQVKENLQLEGKTADQLAKEIAVSALEDAEIIKISVDDEDPELAAKIANETANIFNVALFLAGHFQILFHAFACPFRFLASGY